MSENIKKFDTRKLTKREKQEIADAEFEVRDLRNKFYMVDDAYLNGYARKCGIYATGVYNVLCRHAAKDQTCFPSVRLIADRLGISEKQVRLSLKMLEDWKIIKIKRFRGARSAYWLTDKSIWRRDLSFYGIGRIRKATKAEAKEVKVTWEGERMRPMRLREGQ